MFFDRSERAKRAKERKAELKELKKTMLSGGCDKARVTAHLKEFDDALDAGGAARDDYENARGHLENARGAIRKLLDCMAESPVSEVKERLKNLVAELGEVNHDCPWAEIPLRPYCFGASLRMSLRCLMMRRAGARRISLRWAIISGMKNGLP